MQYETIKELAGLDTLSDSTDASKKRLRVAENILLRPLGGAKRIPKYHRLWGMLNLSSYNASLGLTSGSATCLLQIANEGHVFLAFWDVANSKTLGIVHAADTGLFSGSATLTAGSATVTVLKTGLAANKRWYCYRFDDEIFMGNGVDSNLIYQYSRTALRLRTAGTNETPISPTISYLPFLTIESVQATRSFSDGADVIKFIANTDNYPGTLGHNIRIAVAYSGLNPNITSTRTGAGTSESPFEITFRLGTTAAQATAAALVQFVATDPNCSGVLSTQLIINPGGDLPPPLIK